MVQYQIPMGLRDEAHRMEGRCVGGGSTKILAMLNLHWQGFREKTFTKIEAYAGMAERLVRYFAVE